MRAPQIIWCVLFAISLMCNAYLHGRPKNGTYSVWTALAGFGIEFGLLLWGGFFA
mgnify:CR=1 FL=1